MEFGGRRGGGGGGDAVMVVAEVSSWWVEAVGITSGEVEGWMDLMDANMLCNAMQVVLLV